MPYWKKKRLVRPLSSTDIGNLRGVKGNPHCKLSEIHIANSFYHEVNLALGGLLKISKKKCEG